MRNDGVLDTLTSLLDADPDVADRELVGEMIRHAAMVRGWVDAADVRLARRLRELQAEGRSEAAGMALTDEGRRSGKEANATPRTENGSALSSRPSKTRWRPVRCRRIISMCCHG